MNTFEFLFSLYGLLLGLSLAEVLGGFSRAVRGRWRAHRNGSSEIRLGWLTPMLALFLMLDISSFWMTSWSTRDEIPMGTPSLFFGLAVTGLYFLAASWVFPETDDESGANLDAHYLAHRQPILLIVLVCNLAVYVARFARTGEGFGNWGLVGGMIVGSYFGALLLAIVARSKRLNFIALALLLLVYVADTVT